MARRRSRPGRRRTIRFASFGYSAAGRRATPRPPSDVDIGLVLMPADGKHDWALGNYAVLGKQWRNFTEIESIVGCHGLS